MELECGRKILRIQTWGKALPAQAVQEHGLDVRWTMVATVSINPAIRVPIQVLVLAPRPEIPQKQPAVDIRNGTMVLRPTPYPDMCG